MYKPLQIYPPPPKLVTQNRPPGGFYLEIALKYKVKQSNHGSLLYKFLYLPDNYYVCQRLQSERVTVYLCFRYSIFTLGLDFLGPYYRDQLP